MPTTAAFTQDPYPTFRFLRDYSPVHHEPEVGGWYITRYDDVAALLGPPSASPVPTRAAVALVVDDLLSSPGPDLVHDFAFPLVMRLFGVPDEDRAGVLDLADSQAPLAAVKLDDYLEDLVRWRSRVPADDLVSRLATGPGAEPQVVRAATELIGEAVTCAHFLGNAAFALLRHPSQAALLRDDPSSGVEELLRWDTPVPVAPGVRLAEPAVLSGRRIEAGQLLFPVVGAAHRDPVRYPDPDRLDLRRRPAGVFGSPLWRVVGEVAVVRLFQRFPRMEIADVEPVYRADPAVRGLTGLPVRY